jgi:hypothetical protein
MTLEELEHIFDTTKPDAFGCLNWTGTTGAWGYGRVWIDGVGERRVNRLALERKLGRTILPGHMALHHCNNSACFSTEPGHVYEGEREHSGGLDLGGAFAPVGGAFAPPTSRSTVLRDGTPEAKERARKASRVRSDRMKAEAAARRRFVEDFLAKQNRAQS